MHSSIGENILRRKINEMADTFGVERLDLIPYGSDRVDEREADPYIAILEMIQKLQERIEAVHKWNQ